jgi:pilus assembly protein Flp/PilA
MQMTAGVQADDAPVGPTKALMARRRGLSQTLAYPSPSSKGESAMAKFITCLKKFRGEEGATMVEYGLMLALIAVVCIGAVTLVGTNASTLFNNIAGSL